MDFEWFEADVPEFLVDSFTTFHNAVSYFCGRCEKRGIDEARIRAVVEHVFDFAVAYLKFSLKVSESAIVDAYKLLDAWLDEAPEPQE